MSKMAAVQVMKVILARYDLVNKRDDNKLFDDNVRRDELIIVMREILDKQAEIEGTDDEDGYFNFDLVEEASEYNAIEQATSDGVRENKQVGCFDEDHF